MGCIVSRPRPVVVCWEKGNMANASGNSVSTAARTVYQPLHPSVRPLLDPEYVAFHDEYVQYVEPEYLKPWDPKIRTRFTWPYAGSAIVKVGSIKDIRPCGDFDVRIFTPKGDPPSGGWPLLIWLHGGGFCVGNIDSDSDLCSLACREIRCVVANVDYRLAPENTFPAAVDDVSAVLRWAHTDAGASKLNINRSQISIGGASAGGNLAAVGALLAAELATPVVSQILVAPVIDNTATTETLWASHPHAPWLTPRRMTFFRHLYLRSKDDARNWKASPIFAPKELVRKLPKTYILIPKQDMLSNEALAYARMLRETGVAVAVREYEGMPHSMMALSGELMLIHNV